MQQEENLKKIKKREANRRYYEKHKTEISENKKLYYSQNKDVYAERAKKYYEKHKTKIAKQHKEYYKNNKFKPSKKLSHLINITVSIPSIEEIQTGYERTPTDHRRTTEEYILSALETLSKKTQSEETCKDLIEKARLIFDFYDNKKLGKN